MRINREFDSNEIDESDSQDEKQDDPRISTFRGISIDRSDDFENASDSIRFNPDDDSNDNNSILPHVLKYFTGNLVIDPGIHTRGNTEPS
jgi:hypothetical protein